MKAVDIQVRENVAAVFREHSSDTRSGYRPIATRASSSQIGPGLSYKSTNLDMLRSVAVLLVLGSHILVSAGLPWEGTVIGSLGHLGVMAFFIHTSLVLMMALARLDEQYGAVTIRFYVRRAFRIYPLSILVVLSVIVFTIPENHHFTYQRPTNVELWSNLVLVQNIFHARSLTGPLWSLPFEVQMYLVLPGMYLLGKRIRSPLLFLSVGIVVWYAEHRFDMWAKWQPLLAYTPWFCMGAAASLRRTTRRLPAWLYAVNLSAFVIGGVLAGRFLGYKAMYAEWMLGIGFSLTIPMFMDCSAGRVPRLLEVIAKYSYGVYLSHLPILWFVTEGIPYLPVTIRIVIAVPMLILVPVLLYHVVEQPLMRVGATVANLCARDSTCDSSKQGGSIVVKDAPANA